MPAVTVPERLALSSRALGEAGDAWLTALPGLLAGLEADWLVTVGTGLEGGNAAYVAEAVTRDGTPAVLKVPVSTGIDGFTPFERQLAALQLAGGDPYVGLIRCDVPRQALLLERLGGQRRDPTDIFTDFLHQAKPQVRSPFRRAAPNVIRDASQACRVPERLP